MGLSIRDAELEAMFHGLKLSGYNTDLLVDKFKASVKDVFTAEVSDKELQLGLIAETDWLNRKDAEIQARKLAVESLTKKK